jgi:hypothetical protein
VVSVAIVWAYSIVWSFLTDAAKIAVYHHLEMKGGRHRRLLALLQHPLHSHAEPRRGAGRTAAPRVRR